MCEQCTKWVHTECEVKAGNTDLIEVNEETVYYCITCRKTKKNQKLKDESPMRNQDNSFQASQNKEDSATAAKDLLLLKKEELSHDSEEGHIEKYPTTESNSGS